MKEKNYKNYKNYKKNRNTKKILLSLSSIFLLAAIPIVAVSCSNSSKSKQNNIENPTPGTGVTVDQALSSALNNVKHLSTTNLGKTTLPSKINSSNDIGQYIVLPESTNISNYSIDFSLTNIGNFDDEQGSVVVTLVAKIHASNISQSKLFTVFNFNKNSNIENVSKAQELNQISQNVVALTDLAKTTVPSSILLSNISNYLTINKTNDNAIYKIINIKNPNNALGTLVVDLELDYNGIILDNEFTMNGFKIEANVIPVPDDLEKLEASKGELINPNTFVSTNLQTSGYKELVEQMNLNQNSKIDADLITNINTLLKNTQDYKDITVSVANGTSNIEGILVININGTYKNKAIANKSVTITNFNKTLSNSDLNNITINDFVLNQNNYFNNFQTESTLKQLTTFIQWKEYIQKLEINQKHTNKTYSLLDYFNNEGVTKDIIFNYTGGKNISLSFKVLNSTFENNKWTTNWIQTNNIVNGTTFLPKDIDILEYFIKTATVNEGFISQLAPSNFYWKLKADSSTILPQAFFLNQQVQLTYFPNSDLVWSADNLNADDFNDSNGTVALTFSLTIGEQNVTGTSRQVDLKGLKTFEQIFPSDTEQGLQNNVIQLTSDSSITKRLIGTLKNTIKTDPNISTDKQNPTILKNINYSLIPGSSNSNNFQAIREGVSKWTETNLSNFAIFKFLGQNFSSAWNENSHTYGQRKNVIGMDNLLLDWENGSISVYKSSTSYTFFTNITFNLSSFGLNKQITVYYFVTVLNSEVTS